MLQCLAREYANDRTSRFRKNEVLDNTNPIDFVSMDVPLLIRVLEWAHEEAETDIDLHFAVTNMIKIGKALTMLDYDEIVDVPMSNDHIS